MKSLSKLTTISLLSLAATISCVRSETRVIDGDTFLHQGNRIHIWGLDCPERDANSTRALRNLIEGNRIFLERKGRDRYGRIVALVRIQRTSRAEFFTFDLACAMISLGVCTEYVRYSNNYYRSCKP